MPHFDRGDESGKNETSGCPTIEGAESLSIHGIAHRSLFLIAAACAIFTLVSSIALTLLHLTRYRRPKEQRQIIRIIFTPFIFALVSWGEIANYKIAPYIDPLGGIYESLAICALYLLFVQFAVPNGTFGEDTFQAMFSAASATTTKGRETWPRMSWVMVFQFPLSYLLSTIVMEATLATDNYCANSLKPKFGHFWAQVIKTIGLIVCVTAIFRFYKRAKPIMRSRRGATKLFGFKGIVFLQFIQSWVFDILIDKNVLKHSPKFSYGDLLYGIPNTLLATETVLFTLGSWYAYSANEYSSKANPRDKDPTVFGAIANAMNPSDLLLGMLRIFGILTTKPSFNRGDDYLDVQYGQIRGGRHNEEMNPLHPPAYCSDPDARGKRSPGGSARYSMPPSPGSR